MKKEEDVLKLIAILAASVLIIYLGVETKKSGFNTKLSGNIITNQYPRAFSPYENKLNIISTSSNSNLEESQNEPGLIPESVVEGFSLMKERLYTTPGKYSRIQLLNPEVKEEVGFELQGSGVGMSLKDSNSFYPDNPGELLSDYTNAESLGGSSLGDPSGKKALNSSRIIKLKSAGSQVNYKPLDESQKEYLAGAYSNSNVQSGKVFVNNNNIINYEDSFNTDESLNLENSPGSTSVFNSCETTYPKTVKYNDYCITDGDIPYNEVVDGRVNPRLVSRWQSFTGNYNPKDVLVPDAGILYPTLG